MNYNGAVNLYLNILHNLDDESLYNMAYGNPIVYNIIMNDNILRDRYNRIRARHLRTPGKRY
jgi:hypothetical protein